MRHGEKLRILIISPQCDGEDVGESWMGYQWISRLAAKCDATLLTLRLPGRVPPSVQVSRAEVIEWDGRPYLSRWPRVNTTIKPWYPLFYWRAKQWIRRAEKRGEPYDVVHHLMPLAIRFPSPCVGSSFPYVIGPLAGTLPTPAAFESELETEPGFAKLRRMDQFRLRFDPLLRRTYEDADLVIGSSPYVQDILSRLRVRRFVAEPGAGVDDLAPPRAAVNRRSGELRMVYVGRVVRTKGLRDAVRAMARLRDLPGITLDAAGDGEDLGHCREEAERLGVSSRVRFLGRQSRSDIERLYQEADVFLFPSFREPTGIVLFEAMRNGLPVITTDVGGPGHIVTDECGIRVTPRDPAQFASDLAGAIRRLAGDRAALQALSDGARARVADIGLWDRKVDRMITLYESVIASKPAAR